jgi:hypothetical protein
MKCSRLKNKTEGPHEDELSFPPPLSEQAKYLALADRFLSTNGHRNLVSIDTGRNFQRVKNRKKAA